MFYDGLVLVAAVLGLVLLYFSVRVLLHRGWLLGWFRGMAGLLLVGVCVLSALVAFDIYSYRQMMAEKSIATVSFERLKDQQFKATLVDEKGRERHFTLTGDQWQLDARIVKWSGFFAGWGIKPGYRLDRISGRYYSLEEERNAQRSVYALDESIVGVDVWSWLENYNANLPWIDTVYGSASFLPMADGALYKVTLSHTGLLARPLNEPAEAAINRWQ